MACIEGIQCSYKLKKCAKQVIGQIRSWGMVVFGLLSLGGREIVLWINVQDFVISGNFIDMIMCKRVCSVVTHGFVSMMLPTGTCKC